jgi:hypothetical protein
MHQDMWPLDLSKNHQLTLKIIWDYHQQGLHHSEEEERSRGPWSKSQTKFNCSDIVQDIEKADWYIATSIKSLGFYFNDWNVLIGWFLFNFQFNFWSSVFFCNPHDNPGRLIGGPTPVCPDMTRVLVETGGAGLEPRWRQMRFNWRDAVRQQKPNQQTPNSPSSAINFLFHRTDEDHLQQPWDPTENRSYSH